MEEVTLLQLLEAGCHFGHKSERWHPKAAPYIYTKKDGIHIIDLAKTKAGLEAAATFVENMAASGGEILFIATKRQARGVVKEEAVAAGAPYLVERWIGGFLTNWDQVHKNIQKIIRLGDEQQRGAWKQFPKHEQVKLARYLERLKVFYAGVLVLNAVPTTVFIVDVKKENAAVREAIRTGVPIIGIVDTNSNPEGISYVIAANDDAVGSIQLITSVMAHAYRRGKDKREKDLAVAEGREKPAAVPPKEKEQEKEKSGEVKGGKKEEQKVTEKGKPKEQKRK